MVRGSGYCQTIALETAISIIERLKKRKKLNQEWLSPQLREKLPGWVSAAAGYPLELIFNQNSIPFRSV